MNTHSLCLLLALGACNAGQDIDLSSTNGTSSRAEAVFGQQWLTYGGGALLAHPRIRIVYWGSTGFTSYTQSSMAAYYTSLMGSQWLAWFNDEYAINGQTMGPGQVASSTAISPWSTPTDINTIGSELDRQMTLGYLPAPDADTIYLVHLPTQYEAQWTYSDGSRGDSWSYLRQGAPVRYGVVPDSTAGTARIAMTASSILANLYADPDRGRVDSWVNNYHEAPGVMCPIDEADVYLGDGSDLPAVMLWSNANRVCTSAPLEINPVNVQLTNDSTHTVYVYNNTGAPLALVVKSAPAGVWANLPANLPAYSAASGFLDGLDSVNAGQGQLVVDGIDTNNVVKAVARFNATVNGLYLSQSVATVTHGASFSGTVANNMSSDTAVSFTLPAGFTLTSGPTAVAHGATAGFTIATPTSAAPTTYDYNVWFNNRAEGGSSHATGAITLTCPSGTIWCSNTSTCSATCAPTSCPRGQVDCCDTGVCVSVRSCDPSNC